VPACGLSRQTEVLGLHALAHKHDGWFARSVATANGADARTHGLPARRRVYRDWSRSAFDWGRLQKAHCGRSFIAIERQTKVFMNWPSIESLMETVPLPGGYQYALPTLSDVPSLIKAVEDWFPGLAVGNASCYLREDFHKGKVCFDDRHERDFSLCCSNRGTIGQVCCRLNETKTVKFCTGASGLLPSPIEALA